uniref:Uncharacterized protein n=1 Tax=Parascaris univalens TaxID=6257 RepID=A0A915A3I3_PARUN
PQTSLFSPSYLLLNLPTLMRRFPYSRGSDIPPDAHYRSN